MKVTLPVKREIYKKNNCKVCDIPLTKTTRYLNDGRISRKCKKCLVSEGRKYYAKRKKLLEGSKWF